MSHSDPHSQLEKIQHRQSGLTDHHQRFSDAQQAYISTYIQLADTKAAWVFAISAALIGFLLINTEASPLRASHAGPLPQTLSVVAMLLLSASATFAFLGIAPSLRSTRQTNLFSFTTVAEIDSARDFLSKVQNLDEASLIEERLYHNFDIARICNRKYKRVKQSLWCGVAGVALLGLALILYDFSLQASTIGVETHNGGNRGQSALFLRDQEKVHSDPCFPDSSPN